MYLSLTSKPMVQATTQTDDNHNGFEWSGTSNTDDGNPLMLLDGETVITKAVGTISLSNKTLKGI